MSFSHSATDFDKPILSSKVFQSYLFDHAVIMLNQEEQLHVSIFENLRKSASL